MGFFGGGIFGTDYMDYTDFFEGDGFVFFGFGVFGFGIGMGFMLLLINGYKSKGL